MDFTPSMQSPRLMPANCYAAVAASRTQWLLTECAHAVCGCLLAGMGPFWCFPPRPQAPRSTRRLRFGGSASGLPPVGFAVAVLQVPRRLTRPCLPAGHLCCRQGLRLSSITYNNFLARRLAGWLPRGEPIRLLPLGHQRPDDQPPDEFAPREPPSPGRVGNEPEAGVGPPRGHGVPKLHLGLPRFRSHHDVLLFQLSPSATTCRLCLPYSPRRVVSPSAR